ncbi:MAG: helix-turn-helix domain-containing protein [Chitinophagaceae bacterium]|nr:helix-turn-helix domain-containing protein [Chitinophagaceae bacterium]
MENEKSLLTKEQLADEFKVSTKTIDRYVARGWLKKIKVGKYVRFDPDIIDKVRAHLESAAPPPGENRLLTNITTDCD